MAASKSPLPKIPRKTTLPNIVTTSRQSGTFKVDSALNFYYTGIQAIWLWWEVDLKILKPFLRKYAMTPYDFGDGKGAVNINFFNAAAMYGSGQPGNMGIGGFNETEVNIVAYARAVSRAVPKGVAFEDYLAVGEPTKRVGNMRLWVACDDPVAVAAGKQVFMENKFLTPYTYDVPNLNNGAHKGGAWTSTWTCHDPTCTPMAIYEAKVDLEGLSATASNMSEFIDLSWDAKARRPVASRRNYFGMYQTYRLPSRSKAVSLSFGKSAHPMKADMKKLIGRRRAKAVQTYVSSPCIAEWAGYYADV